MNKIISFGNFGMRVTVLFILYLICGVYAYPSQVSTSDEEWGSRIRNMTNALPHPIEGLTRSDLPIRFEERILEELRRRKDYARLIRLKDEEGMREVVERLALGNYRGLNVASMLSWSRSPHFIEHLVQLLRSDHVGSDKERGIRPGNGDIGYSATIVLGMQGIIVNSPEFSDELKSWVRTRFFGVDDTIELILEWWDENEDHFENEQYHLVRPLSTDLKEREEEPEEVEDSEETEEPLEANSEP